MASLTLCFSSENIENLDLLESEREHRIIHNSLYKLACDLVKSGMIGYSREDKQYKAMGKLRELLEQPGEANQQPSLYGDILEGSTTRHESP